jgi:hypothetical protein
MVIEMTGGVLPFGTPRLPSLEDLRRRPYESSPTFLEDSPAWYALIAMLDDPFLDFMHHALVNGQAVDCYAHLAEEGYEQIVGLPLMLDALTLHAS